MKLAKNKLVKSFDYDSLKDVGSVKPALEVSSKANFRSATHDIKSHWVWFTIMFV